MKTSELHVVHTHTGQGLHNAQYEMEILKEYFTWRPGWPVLIDQLIKPAMTTHAFQAKLLMPRRRGPCDWTTCCDLRVACYLCGMRHLAAHAWNFTQIKLLRETFRSTVTTQCRWTCAALPMRHCVMRVAYLFTQVIFLRNNFRNNYLLPLTYYLLRVTYYLLRVTYYLLRISLNQAWAYRHVESIMAVTYCKCCFVPSWIIKI